MIEKYNDPKYPDVRPRVAVIISVYLPVLLDKQYKGFIDNKFETLKMNLACHAYYKSRIKYDLYVVDNKSPNQTEEVQTFLNKIRALRRDVNEGYSFGGWKWGWEQLRNRHYSYFLFTEDDIVPSKAGWLKEIFDKYNSEDNIGAVGNFLEAHGDLKTCGVKTQLIESLGREIIYNFDGAFTFTSSAVLKQVDEKGGLTVFDCGTNVGGAVRNELSFQSRILELGYSLATFNDGEHAIVHGNDIFYSRLSGNVDKPLGPMVNLNGRHKIEKVRDNFKWLTK